jgi:hypothetical protein
MTRRHIVFFALLLIIATVTAAAGSRRDAGRGRPLTGFDAVIDDHARDMLERGRQIFRFDTFGDQDFWGGTLQLHKAIAGARLGGVGPGVSPRTALAVGLKVDADALPQQLIASLKRGRVDLDTPPSTTRSLRGLAAVSTGGRTVTSTWAPSWRSPRTSNPSRIFSGSATRLCGRFSTRGDQGSSMRAC